MKKYLILAVAIGAMASCTKTQTIEPVSLTVDDAIGFSAYTGTAATKGESVAVTDVVATDKGIGVFAFYQPGVNGEPKNFNSKKYATPDFMYNANVKPHEVTAPATVDYWYYNPVKYWPNNTGDQVSFFAYAPYNPDTTWADLGFSTDVNATKLTASFPIYAEKTAMKDYLFATPALNKSKQRANASGASPDIITFNFNHITSRIALQIGCVLDKMNDNGPMEWTDPNTVITVESIVFKGIAESCDYSCAINADGTLATSPSPWTSSGKQDLVLTSKAEDFQNNTSDYWNPTYWHSDTDKWCTLLAYEDSKPGYLFIAPQDLTDADLVITYKVVTTDALNAVNNSTVTNVVTKPIGVTFESGKAYTLNLLIGMKTVELSAQVVPWTDATPSRIDVPANI